MALVELVEVGCPPLIHVTNILLSTIVNYKAIGDLHVPLVHFQIMDGMRNRTYIIHLKTDSKTR